MREQTPSTRRRSTDVVARRGYGVAERSRNTPRRSLTGVPTTPSFSTTSKTVAKSAVGLTTGVALSAGLGIGTTLVQTPATAAAASSCKAPSTISSTSATSRSASGRLAASCLRAAGHSTKVSSIKNFQKGRSLKQTGVVDKATWAALLSRGSTPHLNKGDHGSAVTRLQGGLKALGYSTPVNGKFGSATERAVKALQKKRHWKRSGKAGHGTWVIVQHGGRYVGKPPARTSGSKGEKAYAYAKKQLGDRYRYGAAGPSSFDCSGLTLASWKAAGVKLPHNTNAQYRKGKKVSKSSLKKGDLVFFYSGRSHVAIYAGGGKVIHAPKPGSKVSYIKMKYMPYNGAIRPA